MRFREFLEEAINYPEVRQATEFTCGAACVQSILSYYDEDWSPPEVDIKKELGTTEDGTKPENIIKFFTKRGFKVDAKKDMSLDNLFNYLDKKIPVMVPLQAWSEENTPNYETGNDNGHYVVAVEHDKTKVYFEDPILNVKGYLTVSEFDKRWHDIGIDGQKFNHYGIAVYGKKPKYNQDDIEHIN